MTDRRPAHHAELTGGAPTGARSTGLTPLRHVLPNGAVILVKQTRTTPAVTIYVGFRAGAAYDPPDRSGLSHFLSKTIDRGTTSRTADELAEELDNRGVSLSVGVNRHATWLSCTCLAEDFSDVLAVVGDVSMHPVFPDSEVETRRGEILTLLGQDQDNPATVAMEALMRTLYGDRHPYGRRMRGTLETVGRIGRADLRQFHQSHFAPRVLSIALVGDVDPERALQATESVFGSWTGTAAAAASFPPVLPATARRVRVIPMMDKSQTDIAYGFTTIERLNPRYYSYWLMNNILGQYALGGRLGDSIREQQGMAYYTFSSLDASVAPGPLVVRAGVGPANVERAVTSIDRELVKFAADGPTDRELAESKQYLIGSMPRTLETNAGIATFLQTSELFGLGLDYDLRLPTLLGEVTREQVHAAAREALDPSRAAVVIAGPYSGTLQ